MKRSFWMIFSLTIALLVLVTTVVVPACGVSDRRFANLTQGINAAHWFAQAPLTAENFQNQITAEDLRLIRSLGFRHVRLPLDPTVLLDGAHPDRLNLENLSYLDRALDQIQAADLAVIVDLHPRSDLKRQLYQDLRTDHEKPSGWTIFGGAPRPQKSSNCVSPVYEDATFVEAIAQFWQTLAQHLSTRNPEQVFLEVLNEPASRDPQVWYAVQTRLLAAMRSGAPDHTLIASANLRVGDDWDTLQALQELAPVADANVVYNFHFYQPMPFTHQGATWGEDLWAHLRDVPYPVDPQAIAALLPQLGNSAARERLRRYGEEGWNAARLDALLQQAEAWGRSHRVRVTCNEFGVYRHAAPPDDRIAWLRDVRSLLERHRIGWALWEYNAGFGILVGDDGDRIPDDRIIAALLEAEE